MSSSDCDSCDEEDSYGSDIYDAAYDSDDYEEERSRKKSYRILKGREIDERQEKDISLLMAALSIPKPAASMLLHYFKWQVDVAQEAWFNDEQKVRKSVGLIMDNPVITSSGNDELTCGICFEAYVPDIRLTSTVGFCGHNFCSECLATYITIAISDGPGCLFLRCPQPRCGAVIGIDTVDLLVSDEFRAKYKKYFLRSYIEENNNTKWCPAPNCDNAVEFERGGDCLTVLCNCSYKFCWNCCEENHSPVDCDTVTKWILKNSSESENVTWILANSKPCPKCKRPIQKNEGCMHMTCQKQCGHQFCWLCLGPWSSHGQSTGGFYACNGYEKAKQQGLTNEEDRKREMAKASLERYTHYYERWHGNHKSREKAIEVYQELERVNLDKLQAKLNEPAVQLNCVMEAWQQVIECRRVLKWTYAYGYYIRMDQNKELFEYLQGEAEAALERLHSVAEKELKEFLQDKEENENDDDIKHRFDTVFRPRLCDLTALAAKFFDNLVKGLENGL